MKNKNNILNLMIGAAALMSPQLGSADSLPVARGPMIEAIAGNCPVGPFGQTSKAGHYNAYCADLTEAEVCLAYLKQRMSRDGELRKNSFESDKAEYCLDVFRAGLVGAE